MKKLLVVLSLAVMLGACTTRTAYGPCIGVVDNRVPKVEYEVSLWNGFVALIFAEAIVVPVFTVATDIYCPIGKSE